MPQRPGKGGSAYKGIACNAPGGLHERCMAELTSRVATGALVLDIAAGRGAFTRRLLDGGFRVAANDMDTSNWSVPEVQPCSIDLNGVFAASFRARFDAVTAIEVIEHLENPAHFLRECGQLLVPGGTLIVTTPNVTDYDSRWAMLRRGILNKFNPGALRDIRHMTILPWWVLETHLRESGYAIQAMLFVGEKNHLGWRRFSRMALKRLLRPLMWDTLPGSLEGDSLVFVASRDAAANVPA